MIKRWIATIGLALLALTARANDIAPETIQLKAVDGVAVHGEYRRAQQPKALLLLFHQAIGSMAEYADIAPRLTQAGYSTLTIDQRSGGELFGKPNKTVQTRGKNDTFLSALPDLEAALVWAKGEKLPIGVVGSSYSSSLVFLLAQRHPKEITALMSFSPGEYFDTPDLVRNAAAAVSMPLFVTQAKTDPEFRAAKAIFDAAPSGAKVHFTPQIGGVHGASTLKESRNPGGAQENWTALLSFLNSVFGQKVAVALNPEYIALASSRLKTSN